MTLTQSRTVDVTTQTARMSQTSQRPPDASDLHLLRLALELQVDAMLLTIGAAARADDEPPVPWRRWAVEDLDAARLLARALLEHDTEPPAALGSGSLGAAAEKAFDDLIARYTSMDDLLTGVLRRPSAGQAWRPAAREALTRCRARLEELHRHKGEDAVRRTDQGRQYLPGELLG